MKIKMLHSITFDNSLDDAFRRIEPESVNAKTLLPLLEEEGADGKPIILIIAGTREDRQPGDYTLHGVKRVAAYQSKTFLGAEQKRHAEEKEERKQAARAARLDQIKTGLRVERKAESGDFDRRYAAQSREQAEAAEREIEEKAATILAKEEGAAGSE